MLKNVEILGVNNSQYVRHPGSLVKLSLPILSPVTGVEILKQKRGKGIERERKLAGHSATSQSLT